MNTSRFRLVPYFSVASLVAFVFVTLLLAILYRQTAINDLVSLRESNNIALTQAFANSLWPEFIPLAEEAPDLTLEELRNHPEIARLDEAVTSQMAGLSVVKMKVYDLDGLTIFSTEPEQIGEDKSENPGFLTALGGGVASELVHKDTFNAFESVIEDRDIVESYVAVRNGTIDGPIEGVIEVYDDVTALLQRIDETQRNIALAVFTTLTVLYFVLLVIVKRADTILKRQRVEILDQQQTLLDVNQQLRLAQQTAEDATRLKSEFLATMSHELRTPLNAIIGYTGIMLQGVSGTIDQEARRMVGAMHESGQHLLGLVNAILDLSKIEAGRLELVNEPFDVQAFTDDIQTQMQVLADQKKLLFDIDIESNVPGWLDGDQERIKQIVINLLSNAFKFTEKGAVGLYLSWQQDELWLRVRDTGVGIPPHMLPHIFEEFRQVDGSSSRQQAGTGLGLAIVRKLAQTMGGKATVESTLGEGTVFTISLPLKPSTETEPMQVQIA